MSNNIPFENNNLNKIVFFFIQFVYNEMSCKISIMFELSLSVFPLSSVICFHIKLNCVVMVCIRINEFMTAFKGALYGF